MLDFVPSIRKLPNTRYCCRNLEFFPNPNISNIRQLFSAENTAENVFVVTLSEVIRYVAWQSAGVLTITLKMPLYPSSSPDEDIYSHLGVLTG